MPQIEKPRITITAVEVSDEYCWDILTTCVEGGSTDWAEFRNVERDNELNIHVLEVHEFEEPAEKPGWHRIDVEDIRRGIQILSQPGFNCHSSYKQMVFSDNNDAMSCDLVLQAAVFGKAIYC